MKPFVATCFAVVVATWMSGAELSAQEGSGGFGGPAVKLTEVDDRFGVLVGGRGGWIVDGSWVIGGGGYSLVNVSNFEHLTNQGDSGGLEMAYGGAELAYVHKHDEPIQMSVGLLLGAGGLTWTPDNTSGDEMEDAFFVAEPSASTIVRVTSFLRLALGVSYRLSAGVELLELDDSDVSGFAGFLGFNFGSS